MAQRWIQKDELLFRVHNTYSHSFVVGNRKIDPGKYADIPARHLVGNVDRCIALAAHVAAGHLSVFPKYDDMGFTGGINGSTVSAAYLKSLQASTGMPFGMNLPFDPVAGTRPAFNDVPEGFGGYNTNTDLPNYSDGTAYVDATGAPA